MELSMVKVAFRRLDPFEMNFYANSAVRAKKIHFPIGLFHLKKKNLHFLEINFFHEENLFFETLVTTKKDGINESINMGKTWTLVEDPFVVFFKAFSSLVNRER